MCEIDKEKPKMQVALEAIKLSNYWAYEKIKLPKSISEFYIDERYFSEIAKRVVKSSKNTNNVWKNIDYDNAYKILESSL